MSGHGEAEGTLFGQKISVNKEVAHKRTTNSTNAVELRDGLYRNIFVWR
jgi:hypothetical protein